MFWADQSFRLSYSVFGDAVSFDTTYNKNKYDLVFGAILGMKHHDQTIVFGCCFLSNENFEAFEWLFKTWLEDMPMGPPISIVTDQDPAITKAVASVMTNAQHRFCIWHIKDKLTKKLGGIAIHSNDFRTSFKIAIESIRTEQFESEWNKMIIRFNLTDNNWLQELYSIRHKWVPCYLENVFFGRMPSSQRSESFNAFIKQYKTEKSGMYDFILRFERAMSRKRYQ